MHIYEWLDQKDGRTSEMASHFGLTLGAISQWRSGVPYARMKDVEDFTGGVVTVREMIDQRIYKKLPLHLTKQ